MPHLDKDTHNDYMKKYILNRYHKRREEAIVTLGSKCVSCSSVENLARGYKCGIWSERDYRYVDFTPEERDAARGGE